MHDTVAELVRKTHGGEVLGVELFRRLARAQTDPERRRCLEAARLLEEQTAAVAVGLAADLGITLDDASDQREAGREAAEALATMDWSSCMRAVADGTGGYRALYSELGAHLDAREHPEVAALVSHERALHDFAVAEASGEPNALDHLTAALDPARRAQVPDL